jgi:hypothetical protein
MNRSFLRPATIVMAAVLSLSACGGGGSNTNEPAGAVSAAMDAAESGGFAKLLDYTCAAKKGDVAALFGGGDLSGLGALGIDTNALFDAVKMDFQDIKTSETSKSGDKATVHVTGKMLISFDEAKMKDVFKQILSKSSLPADDATINAMLAGMSGSLSQAQDLDEDIDVVQEGGKWLICE